MRRQEEPHPATEALHEHQALQESIRALLSWFQAHQRLDASVSQELVDDLQELRDHLDRHFQIEEEQRLFEDILRKIPTSDSSVKRLRQDHIDMLATLDALIRRAADIERETADSIRNELNSFFEAYQEHEALENDLLQRAYCLDLGSAD